ncbi:hypothetical protein C8R45DRAFT_933609 [Mycena sanguinolenta]|nr:hypothetical protein C8R45DRAFT_933609 [Mycena sanguinolenta]
MRLWIQESGARVQPGKSHIAKYRATSGTASHSDVVTLDDGESESEFPFPDAEPPSWAAPAAQEGDAPGEPVDAEGEAAGARAQAAGEQVHRESPTLTAGLVVNRRQTPKAWIMGRIVHLGDHFLRPHSHASAKMPGFPQLLELWGDGPLPPLPTGPLPFLGVPTWGPWVGTVVDEAHAKSALIRERLHAGKSLPAHTYTEFSTPPVSPWWPPVIMALHADASQEEQEIKLSFDQKYPYRTRCRHLPSRDALVFPPGFLEDRKLLHHRLACTQAIFWIRTRVETGGTASAAALENAMPGARAAAAAAAEQEYTWDLLQDDYLAGWGTSRDPRIGSWAKLPTPSLGGWGLTPAWTTSASESESDGWGSGEMWGSGGPRGSGTWDTGSSHSGWAAAPPSPPPAVLCFRAQ